MPVLLAFRLLGGLDESREARENEAIEISARDEMLRPDAGLHASSPVCRVLNGISFERKQRR